MSTLMIAVPHIPVLLEEVIQTLGPKPGGRYVDCTVGAGGHAAAIIKHISPRGRLLGLDADPEAIRLAREALPLPEAILVNANFANLEVICSLHDFRPVDGIIFDLGVSSPQLGPEGRGFSFQHEAPVDMRYDPQQEITAAHLVNTLPEAELARLLWRHGEERHSRQIARSIVRHRPLNTTLELAQAVSEAVPGRGRLHPATRTFLALRIAVNRELDNLATALRQVPNLLSPGGRLVVISYHSLEDRLVKEFLRRESKGCICSPDIPSCICGHTATLKLLFKKPVIPGAAEVEANPRSRSARLRAAERL